MNIGVPLRIIEVEPLWLPLPGAEPAAAAGSRARSRRVLRTDTATDDAGTGAGGAIAMIGSCRAGTNGRSSPGG